ncbi:MAG: type II toxin-antitoxin system VapC family toxin [Euzebya sp.]
MIDTSALVAALVAEHEHHDLARAELTSQTKVPVIVVAETFAVLRRAFGQTAAATGTLLGPWTGEDDRLLPTSASAVRATFARATELDLAGSIHDALIAQVCIENEVRLVTLDTRQHQLALALGADSRYLLS